MVDTDKLSDDVTVNVLLLLETEGDEDIWIQVLKLSDETWKVPEQDVFDEFVVTDVASIDSENITEMVEVTETEVSLSEGDVDETVGVVVSGAIPVVNPEEVVHWELKLFPELSLTFVVTRIL